MYMVAGLKRWSDEEVVEGQEGLTGTNSTIKVKFTNKWAIKSSPDDQTISDIRWEFCNIRWKLPALCYQMISSRLIDFSQKKPWN